MVTWPWQRDRKPARTLRVRSRGDFGDVRRVDFEELAPDIDTYLGQAAYLQLGYFETLSQLIAPTPELSHKESLSRAAGAALLKHRELVEVIRSRGDDPLDIMLPFREPLDAFRRATHGARPLETMLSVHITAGMLDDFYLALSSSYGDTGRRVARILRADDDRQAIVDTLFSDNYPLATGALAKTALGYVDTSSYYVYDQAKATSLLDEAGWVAGADGIRTNDGVRLSLTFNDALPQPRSKEVVTIIQEQLAKIGIEVKLFPGDMAAQTAASLDQNTVQVYHSMVGRADFDVLKSQYFSKNRNTLLNRNPADNSVADPKLDELLA